MEALPSAVAARCAGDSAESRSAPWALARIAADPDGADSVRFAHDRRFLLSGERTFLRSVQP